MWPPVADLGGRGAIVRPPPPISPDIEKFLTGCPLLPKT